MATWIVHLRLTENLLPLIHGLDASYFAIGSIAPDSGIPDENWENFTPPPEVSHFKASGGSARELADMDFYRRYLQSVDEVSNDPLRFSFLLGYFFHLVTDNEWSQKVGQPTQARFAEEFDADPEFIWEVKRDWYGLDFDYVRKHRDSIFWTVFLKTAYTHDYIDFLPQEAVQQRIAYIKELYQKTDEEIEEWYIDRPNLYLLQEDMDDFVSGTTDILYAIYQQLWEKGADHSDLTSALGLIGR
ncbi:MAG: hypothetical protein GTO18_22215 [Anaerolineales bacterium]|nr:hypothetical protein [Anaerolineales bacterium]